MPAIKTFDDDVTTGAQAIARASDARARRREFMRQARPQPVACVALPPPKSLVVIDQSFPYRAPRPVALIQNRLPARWELSICAHATFSWFPERNFTYSLMEFQRTYECVEFIREVCKVFRVTRVDIISARRTARIVEPRQIAMMLCKNLTTNSLPAVGRRFGNRDHTTVLHAVNKFAPLWARLSPMMRDGATAREWVAAAYSMMPYWPQIRDEALAAKAALEANAPLFIEHHAE
jgi:hypothetical protein